jgi:hypothetical protein
MHDLGECCCLICHCHVIARHAKKEVAITTRTPARVSSSFTFLCTHLRTHKFLQAHTQII